MKWNKDIEVYNEDNMITMSRYPDNYFDLAVVDPPYGGNDAINLKDCKDKSKQATKRTNYKSFANNAPTKYYFNELKRVSKEQIIWGVNFYKNFDLSGGRICWDKKGTAFGRAELAYYSKSKSVNVCELVWNGMIQHNMKDKQKRIHPTEKPIALYEWIYRNYAKENFKILDTHLGSGSNAVAIANMNKIENMNLSLVAAELDTEYFNASKVRFDLKTSQGSLFAPAA